MQVEPAFRSRLTTALLAALLSASVACAEPPGLERLGEEACRALTGLYDYDATIPLEARIVERKELNDGLREKIVLRGVQGFLVPGYLQLPATGDGPFACVLLLHGWSGSKDSWYQDGNYISGGDARRALLEAGFAVLALDAQCHGDRIAQNDFAPVNHHVDDSAESQPRKGYFSREDIYVQTTRDYRRAIDYLLSRTEIDGERIGVLGYSMGGTQAFLLTGVDPRVKAAVAVAAPAERSKWTIVAPQNFVDGIGKRPLLSIYGRQDAMCPVPFAEALHASLESEPKQQIFFDAEHRLPADYVPHAAAWLKKHL